MTTRLRIPLLVVLVALGIVLAACSGESSDATTTTEATTTTVDTSDQALVLGRGTVPDTVPDDFPIPEQAVIGATLIDRTRGLTEVVITYPANVDDVAAYYATNLEVLGYAITDADGNDAERILAWERDEMTGEVIIEIGGSGVSQGILRFLASVTS